MSVDFKELSQIVVSIRKNRKIKRFTSKRNSKM